LTASYGSDNDGYPINGYYYNAEFKHGAVNVFSTAEEIETYIDTQELPSDADCHCGGPVLTKEHAFDSSSDVYGYEWSEDEHDKPREYAVYGWAKSNSRITDDSE